MEDEFKKIIKSNRPRICLGAEFLPFVKCSKLMNAHSIQNKGVLDFIAGGSQVVLHRRLEINETKEIELLSFEKIGRGVATIFSNGMCSNHDKELFQCVEDQGFDVKNKKQTLTFAIRSLLKEIYTKSHIAGISNTIFNGNNLNPFLIGYKQANVTLAKTKNDLRRVYIQQKKNFEDFETVIFTFDIAYKVACSSVISMWFGFNGEKINSQELNPKKQYLLYVNVFPGNGKTYVLLGHLRRDKKVFQRIIKHLKGLGFEDLQKALSALLVCYCQNLVFSESLLDDKKLVQEINRITINTQRQTPYQDIINRNYLQEIISRGVNLFIIR